MPSSHLLVLVRARTGMRAGPKEARPCPALTWPAAVPRACGPGAAVLYNYNCIHIYYTNTCNAYVVPYYAMPCYNVPYYNAIQYYTILYYTILYYTILYCAILYYTRLYITNCYIPYYTRTLHYTTGATACQGWVESEREEREGGAARKRAASKEEC